MMKGAFVFVLLLSACLSATASSSSSFSDTSSSTTPTPSSSSIIPESSSITPSSSSITPSSSSITPSSSSITPSSSSIIPSSSVAPLSSLSSSSGGCDKYNCTTKECQGEVDNKDDNCFLIPCCPHGYYCNNVSKCITDTNGDYCDTVDDCLPNKWGTLNVVCKENKCKELLNSGDTCDKTADCAGNMSCSKDECSHIGVNKTCLSVVDPTVEPPWAIIGQDCDFNNYCDPVTMTCQPMLKEKANCTKGQLPMCGMNLACDPLQGKCIKMFSLENGAECPLGEPFLCKSDHYCKDVGDKKIGNCSKAADDKYKSCKNDTDCGNFSCLCFPNGKMYCEKEQEENQPPCMEELDEYYDCLKEEECSTGIFSQNENSCSQLNCEPELSDYKSCMLCDLYDMESCVSKDDQDMYCPAGELETWEKLTILAVIVVVVIVIIVVITACCCCSTKAKKYQPI